MDENVQLAIFLKKNSLPNVHCSQNIVVYRVTRPTLFQNATSVPDFKKVPTFESTLSRNVQGFKVKKPMERRYNHIVYI